MTHSAMEDPFDVLEVPLQADDETIKSAHRVKIRQCHPDVGGSVEEAARINWARDALLDPLQRLDHVLRRARRTLGGDGAGFDRPSTHSRSEDSSAGPTPGENGWRNSEPPNEHWQQDRSPGAGPASAPETTPPGDFRAQSQADSEPTERSIAAWWVTIGIAAALSFSIVATAVTAWRSAFVMPHEWGVFVLAGLGWLVLVKAWWLSGRKPIPGRKSRGVATRVALSLMMLFTAASILIVADQSPFARSRVHDGWATLPNGAFIDGVVPGVSADSGECQARGTKTGGSAPDAQCSPGVIVRGASRVTVCQQSLLTEQPNTAATRAARKSVTDAYRDGQRDATGAEAAVAFVVPPRLGGVWHLQNLWFGESTASSEVVAGIADLLCRDDAPITYQQVLRAAQDNRLDALLRINT